MKKLLIAVLLIELLSQSKIFAQFGDALQFDGTSGYVTANSVSTVGNMSNMTMEVWCYPTTNSNWHSIVAFNTLSGGSSNRNMIEYDGSVQKFAYFDQESNTQYSSSFYGINSWYHVAVVITPAVSNNGILYVNGVIQNTFTTTVRPDVTENGQFSIGQEWDNPSPSEYFSGYIDEVRIWNIARTQAEIQSTMNTTLAGNETGLAAYYQMTDGSGTTLTDNSGNNHTGTLVGGVNFAAPLTPLPVELTSFSANINPPTVSLNWQTATELNNYGFEVEKIVDSSESTTEEQSPNMWVKIGFVQGNGNSNSPKDYSFVDAKPNTGKSYYRLKMIDIDGTFEYSKEIEVNRELLSKFSLNQNYPNPFNPTTTISYQLPVNSFVTLNVYDVLGKVMATLVNGTKEAGNYQVKFDASNLSSGIYLYKLQTGSFFEMKKMLLAK